MGLRICAVLLILSLCLALGAAASAETEQKGNLRVTVDGRFAPKKLPRNRLVGISFEFTGSVSTTDGSHPPPLKRLQVAINRHGRLSSVGLPVCSAGALQSTSSEAALALCRRAIVGRGSFEVDVPFAETTARGRVLAFNSRRGGKPSLLLHLFLTVPVRVTLIVPLSISHSAKGDFGTQLSGNIPKLAGGLGAITHIDLTLARSYSYRGQRRNYLSASCSAPAELTLAPFPLVKGTFTFSKDQSFHAKLIRFCHVR
jgi:hypothetical protein